MQRVLIIRRLYNLLIYYIYGLSSACKHSKLQSKMANDMPAFVFRVYSNQSSGTNAHRLFKPASCSLQMMSDSTNETPETFRFRGEQLRQNLLGNEPESPYVFFSDNVLFALAYANFRVGKGAQQVMIACINTTTAKTSSGEPVRFYRVKELLENYDVVIRNKDRSIRTYEDEIVTTTSLVPGAGSCFVPYQTLVDKGLHMLHPELDEIDRRPRIYLAMRMLRQYWFQKEFFLTEAKISGAAQLALCFKDCRTNMTLKPDSNTLKRGIAVLLAVQKRSSEDPVLKSFLGLNTRRTLEGPSEAAVDSRPDVLQCKTLIALVKNVDINAMESVPSVDNASTDKARRDFRAWKDECYKERRASRMAREDYEPHRKRRYHSNKSARVPDAQDQNRVSKKARYKRKRN